MLYFEFLHGSTIICLPLNISEKFHQQHLFEKLEEAETHCLHLCQSDSVPTYPEQQHLPFRQMRSNPFFHLDTNPVLDHVLFYSVNKTNVLVVRTVWLWFFNIVSLNFASTPNKSLRFTRLRRSYINHPAVILANHCQSYTASLFDVRCSKWLRSFFYSCLSPVTVHLDNLFLLSKHIA